MACNGKKVSECPVRLCARGVIPSKETYVSGRNPVNGQKLYGVRAVKHRCEHCDGTGYVDCPYCE